METQYTSPALKGQVIDSIEITDADDGLGVDFILRTAEGSEIRAIGAGSLSYTEHHYALEALQKDQQ